MVKKNLFYLVYLSFKGLVLETMQVWKSEEAIAGDITSKVIMMLIVKTMLIGVLLVRKIR